MTGIYHIISWGKTWDRDDRVMLFDLMEDSRFHRTRDILDSKEFTPEEAATLFLTACYYNNHLLAEYFVYRGVPINIRDSKYEQNCLHFCCESETISRLLKLGADPQAYDCEGNLPITTAMRHCPRQGYDHDELRELIIPQHTQNQAILRAFILHGYHLEIIKPIIDMTPLDNSQGILTYLFDRISTPQTWPFQSSNQHFFDLIKLALQRGEVLPTNSHGSLLNLIEMTSNWISRQPINNSVTLGDISALRLLLEHSRISRCILHLVRFTKEVKTLRKLILAAHYHLKCTCYEHSQHHFHDQLTLQDLIRIDNVDSIHYHILKFGVPLGFWEIKKTLGANKPRLSHHLYYLLRQAMNPWKPNNHAFLRPNCPHDQIRAILLARFYLKLTPFERIQRHTSKKHVNERILTTMIPLEMWYLIFAFVERPKCKCADNYPQTHAAALRQAREMWLRKETIQVFFS